jgi:AcrR family transcriptional regulator
LFVIFRAAYEETMTLPGKQLKDRRVQKTQKFLHEALFSLIHDKSYDSIAVKEILDRANVGRSTFYMHFRDKDELLVSGMHDMLRSVQAAGRPPSAQLPEKVIAFSLPIFEHIHQQRHAGGAMIGTRGRAIIHEHLQTMLVGLIADDVKTSFQRRRKTAGEIPPDMVVQYVASTFILVLNWWAEHRSPMHPKEANDLFRALVLPPLAAILE